MRLCPWNGQTTGPRGEVHEDLFSQPILGVLLFNINTDDLEEESDYTLLAPHPDPIEDDDFHRARPDNVEDNYNPDWDRPLLEDDDEDTHAEDCRPLPDDESGEKTPTLNTTKSDLRPEPAGPCFQPVACESRPDL